MARPVGYDREQVIEHAMQQFWKDGFGDCDVDTLTRTAGINRHSLYKSFGGKAGLFHAALKYYVAHVAPPFLALLNQGETLDDLIGFFSLVCGTQAADAAQLVSGYDRRGCLIANSVVELGRTDPQANGIIDDYYRRFEDALTGLVRRAQAGGTIRAELDAPAIAHWLMLTGQGLSLSARREDMAVQLPDILRATLAPRALQ